jgi:hypothetical protein
VRTISIWDRIGEIASTIRDAGESVYRVPVETIRAPLGFIGDIATSPWNDDEEYNGVLNTLKESLQRRIGQQGATVPQAIGTAYSAANTASQGQLQNVVNGYNWLWSNVVSQPLSAELMAGTPALIPLRWNEAEHTSPGRVLTANVAATAAGVLPGQQGVDRFDLNTARGVNAAVADLPAGSFASGSLDFAANVFLDPTVGLGKGLKGLKVAALVRPVTTAEKAARIAPLTGELVAKGLTPEQAEAIVAGSATDRFLVKLFTKDTPAKRAAWLHRNEIINNPRDPAAMFRVKLLSEAPDIETARAVMRNFLDPSEQALFDLETRWRSASYWVRDLSDNKIPAFEKMLNGQESSFQADWINRSLTDMRNRVLAEQTTASRLHELFETSGSLRRVPRVTAGQRLSGWQTYQPSVYNVPMRVLKAATTYRPGVINYHEEDSWINLSRALDQSGVNEQTKGNIMLDWAKAAELGPNEAGKKAVLDQAEEHMADALGVRFDLDPQAARYALEHARVRRQEIFNQLEDRRYFTPTDDGKWVDMLTGDGSSVRMPIWVTQVENYHSLIDITDAARVMSRYKTELKGRSGELGSALARVRSGRAVTGSAAMMEEIAQGMNNVWKPLQLLRLGYPVRNVTDEYLRMVAMHGVLSSVPMTARSLAERHGEKAFARKLDKLNKKVAEGKASPVEEEILAQGEATLGRQELFAGTERVRGYDARQIYNGPGGSSWRAAASSRDTMRQFAEDQGAHLSRLRNASVRWDDLSYGDKGYNEALLRDVNDQIREDEIGKRLIAGETDDQIVRWLGSEEGFAHRRRIGVRGGNPYLWVREMRDVLDTYVPHEGLRALAQERKLRVSDFEKTLGGSRDTMPKVHGPSVAEASRKSVTMQNLRAFTDKAMDQLGAAPNDVLVRHPFAMLSYKSKLGELIDSYEAGAKLSDKTMAILQDRARAHALRQTRETMYDLIEQPNIARSVRFLAPFYGAWHDMIVKWGRLFTEDPSRIGRGLQLWELPDKAEWTQTDEFGNQVVIAPIPKWAQEHIPGLKSVGSMAFKKESLLPMTSGQTPLLPGAGYLVAVPLAWYVRQQPDLADSVKLILPFGPGQDITDQLLPAWMKRVNSIAKGTDDRAYANAYNRILIDLEYERNIGKNDLSDGELASEARRRARMYFAMRTVVNLGLPAIPTYRSPYEMYYKAAREYRAKFGYDGGPDGASWDVMFMRDFGDSFFPFTQSMSKSLSGIAPTESGFRASKKWGDLVAKYPELSGLIVGDDDGTGQFSRAVYEWQFRAPIGPGSPIKQRRPVTPSEMIADQQVSLGWRDWINAMKIFDTTLQARGLNEVTDNGAQDLLRLKQALRMALSDKYPAWREAYNNRPEASDVVAKIKNLASDERFDGAPGWASMREYLNVRDQVVARLRERWQAGGSFNLQAQQNLDLRFAFEAFTGDLRKMDSGFNSMWSRYLDYDQITQGV